MALVCDAGVICPDGDQDGFAKCGCPWSGTPCDCNDDDPAVYPGAPEICDSTRDTNCNGALDGCAKGFGCVDKVCVPDCIPNDDFGCAAGSYFFHPPEDNLRCSCKPMDCTIFGCPVGQTCDDTKTCVPTCTADVRCPVGQICRGFGCVDPCAAVTCPTGALCVRGTCIPSCSCEANATCPAGQTCDVGASTPTCVEPACVGVACSAGTHCVRGRCQTDCEGVSCPLKRVCRVVGKDGGVPRGECVDICSPDPCPRGDVCEWRTGTCTTPPSIDGDLVPPAELKSQSVEAEVGGAGWFCSAPALPNVTALSALGLVVIALGLTLRRRARR